MPRKKTDVEVNITEGAPEPFRMHPTKIPFQMFKDVYNHPQFLSCADVAAQLTVILQSRSTDKVLVPFSAADVYGVANRFSKVEGSEIVRPKVRFSPAHMVAMAQGKAPATID